MRKQYDILTDYICNYIYPNNLYIGEYKMRIASENSIKIIYKRHHYIITIIEEDGIFYWSLKPYRDSFFATRIDNYSSLDRVLFAIKEHHEIKYQKK